MKKLIILIIILIVIATPIYAETLDVNVINVPDVTVTNIVPNTADKPQGVTVTGITDTKANVSWEASDGATQYMVYLNGIQVMGSNAPGLILNDLISSTEYEVYVIANNSGGSSPASDTVYFKTLPIAPSTPDTPILNNQLSNSISLTWPSLPVNQDIKSYRIYIDGTVIQDIESEHGGFQSVTLTDIESGEHTVNISGVNENKEGPLSSTLTFTISEIVPPAGLKMINHGTDTVLLSWLPVIGAKRYIVSLDGQVNSETYDSEIVLENLNPESKYMIEVEAVGETGNKSVPAVLEVNTLKQVEQLNPKNIFTSINNYFPPVVIYIEVIFAIVASIMLARQLKLSL